MNTRNITAFAAFAAACLAGSTAYAGPKPVKAPKTVEPPQESCITGDIGFDVVSNYISKGIVYNNQGGILQPYADLHFRIYKGAGALTSVTADIGIWNSFHSHTGAGIGPVGGTAQNRFPGAGPGSQTTANWFEFDFIAGLTFNFDKLAIGGYFKTYESPSSVFQNTYTAGITVAYDDSAALGAFALHPYALVELQLEGTTGNNFGIVNGPFVPAVIQQHGRGQYYEVGIAPGHTWGDLTLSLPIKGGFGSGGFYLGNRGFGYVSVGLRADYALHFIPACLGKWTVSAGGTYYRLGGNNDLSSGPLSGAAGLGTARLVIPQQDRNQWVFQGGLKVAF